MSVKPTRCILIDDDPDDQEIFLLALKRVGMPFECLVANDGEKGMEKLRDPDIALDYIFLDLNMQRMDGKKCLLEIKKLRHLASVPVIMYSTSSYINDIRETRRLGAKGFVTKPSDINVLVKILSQIFTHSYAFHSSEYYQ